MKSIYEKPDSVFAFVTTIAIYLLLPVVGSHGQLNTNRNDSGDGKFDLINLGLENAPDEVIEPLLEQLGSPDFSTREAASKLLAEQGPAAFAKLARHFSDNDDYEVRLRIQDIVKEQYLWHTLLKHKGFMGVVYDDYSGPPLARDQTAFIIRQVELGYAAHESGLRPRDLVVTMNGQSTGELNKDEFAKYIQDQGAGTTLVVGVLRADNYQRSTKIIEKSLTLGARPIEHYNNAELLEELNFRMQAFSIWWEKYFSLPRVSRDRLPTSEVLQIPK